MRRIVWEKRGRIITPEDGPAWRRHLSGAVHVMPLENDRYRVYLTGVGDDVPTALKEPGRRSIGWLELGRDFRIVHENPDNPVLSAGTPGCFDCEGVVMPMIVRMGGPALRMYYVGFGPCLGRVLDNNPGLAVSEDNGATWRRWSRAPLPVRDDADPFNLGTIWVINEAPDRWRIWYTAITRMEQLADKTWRNYAVIKYATSRDGIHWEKPPNNIAIDFANDRELQIARPMVIRETDGYRMWFSYRTLDTPYRIGYAESADGMSWTRKPSGIDPSPEGWDSEMVEYAFVLKEQDRYLMFYNGNGFGGLGTGLAVGTAVDR